MNTFLTFAVRQGGVSHDSLKEISIVYVENGLIYDAFNAKVGDIGYEDFNKLWKEAKTWFDKSDTVYSFSNLVHKSNLQNTLNRFGYELPVKNWLCASQLVKFRMGSNLTFLDVCSRLNITQTETTMDKAVAVSKIILNLQQENNVITIDTFIPESFEGKNIVVTGVFENINRGSLIAIVESKGGNIQSSINSKTDIVLMGMNAGASKMQKIQEINLRGKKINVIDYKNLNNVLS